MQADLILHPLFVELQLTLNASSFQCYNFELSEMSDRHYICVTEPTWQLMPEGTNNPTT